MADFEQILRDANIPTTEAELKAQWKLDVANAGSSINNDNKYSPFWRVVSALITQPALWLIRFLIDVGLPSAFVKTAPNAALDLLADGVDLKRKKAFFTLGLITFTRGNIGQAVTIPVGTIIQTALLNGKIYQLKTTEARSFLPGLSTLRVPVKAVDAGAAFNLAAGYFAILPVPIANIVSVTNEADWITQPGADVEGPEDLRARIRNQFGTASDFHTDSVYRALIANFPGVAVDAIWFEHDAPRGPGTANAFVLFDFAAPVTQYLSDINQFITDDGNHGHGDDLQVYQMPEQEVTLSLDVWHAPFLEGSEIALLQADIATFINAAFRENQSYSPTFTKPFSRFSFSKLGQELHREFANISSLDFSLDDIVSELWVPRLTDLTINMQVTE